MNANTVSDEQARQLLASMSEEQLQQLRDSIPPSELKAEIENVAMTMPHDSLKELETPGFQKKVAQKALTNIMLKKAKKALGFVAVGGAGAAAVGATQASEASSSIISSLTEEQKEIFSPFIERMDLSSVSTPDISGGADIDLSDILESVLESIGEAISSVDWGELGSRLLRGLLGGG